MKCGMCGESMQAVGCMGMMSMNVETKEAFASVVVTHYCEECESFAIVEVEPRDIAIPRDVKRMLRELKKWEDSAMNAILDQIEKEYGIEKHN